VTCPKCKVTNSFQADYCHQCHTNISNLNLPLGILKKIFLIVIAGTPFIMLVFLSSYYNPPFLAVTTFLIVIPLLFYIIQYSRMRSSGEFLPLETSRIYLFIYYLAVTLLFIQHTSLSTTLSTIGYIAIHFIAYLIFVTIISRHREWIIRYGIFTTAEKVNKQHRSRSIYSVTTFRAIIAMLTKIAKSDGIVSQTEAKFITKTIDNFIEIAKTKEFNSSKLVTLRKQLIDTYKQVKDDHSSITSHANQLLYHSFEQKVLVFKDLVVMAKIEGFCTNKEKLIYRVGEVFGFHHEQIERYIGQSTNGNNPEPKTRDNEYNPYKILGCNKSDDNATIKKKYRELVKQYHPDTMHHSSDDKVFLAYAKDKMQEFNDAYESIKRERRL
jgi:DnaJ like chaperone protein